MLKICTGCGIGKPFEDYGKDKKGKFGLNQKCKICCRIRNKETIRSKESIDKIKRYKSEWQKKKKDLLNARLRERHTNNLEESRSEARKRALKHRQTEGYKHKKNEYDRMYRKEHKEKAKAHDKVKRAIAQGQLIRSNVCEVCKCVGKTHAHHEDYSKPLDVIWKCPTCHISNHRNHEFHAERLNKKTSKEDAKVCTRDESTRGKSEEFSPPVE